MLRYFVSSSGCLPKTSWRSRSFRCRCGFCPSGVLFRGGSSCLRRAPRTGVAERDRFAFLRGCESNERLDIFVDDEVGIHELEVVRL